MLPFNVEPVPILGLTPAEQAQRQRQRMLQAGVFVCCLLLLLDTNQPPSPAWRKEIAQDATSKRAAAVSARLDDVLGNSIRQIGEKPANITGYYNGDWAAALSNGTIQYSLKKKNKNLSSKDFGAAVLQLEMIPAINLHSISLVRGLVILAQDKTDLELSISAFGVYFHSLGRIALAANVGSPYTDIILQWTRRPSIKNETTPDVKNTADLKVRDDNFFLSTNEQPKNEIRARHRQKRNNMLSPNSQLLERGERRRRRESGESGQRHKIALPVTSDKTDSWSTDFSRANLRRRLSLRNVVPPHSRGDDDTATAEEENSSRGIFASSPPAPPPGDDARTTIIELSSIRADYFSRLELVLRTALPESIVSKQSKNQQNNFSLPLTTPILRNAGQLVRDRRRRHKHKVKNQSTSFKQRRLRANAKKKSKDSNHNIYLDELPYSGSVALHTAKPLAYTIHPFLADVWRSGKCGMFLDLEELPTERAIISSMEKKDDTIFEELAGRVVGTINGCGIEADICVKANRVDWDAARRAAFGYSFLMTIVCIVQIGLLFRQLHFSRTQAVAGRVSLLCVATQSLIDAVLCVANLLLCAVVQNLFAAFAAVAFFELVVFCVVEMRYLIVVFQAHDPQRFWLQASTRRQLAILHAQFYFALFAALCAVYTSRDDIRLVTIIAYSFWIPQIIRNVRFEFTQPFHDYYLYGIAITRIIPVIYVYGYPYSLVSIIVHNAKLRPIFCLVLMAWQGVQVAILQAQKYYGARFFVPSCFLPARYDYRRPLPPIVPPRRTSHRRVDTIGTATDDPTAGEQSIESNTHIDHDDGQQDGYECSTFICIVYQFCLYLGICFQYVLPENRDYLITPCDHVFHSECLLQWMDYKAECPVCRSTLPPI